MKKHSTPVPLVVYVTATPFSPAETEPVENPTPVEPYITPTPAPADAAITITRVQDIGNGQAIISWQASGDFPAGFRVVWSATDQGPPTRQIRRSTALTLPRVRPLSLAI